MKSESPLQDDYPNTEDIEVWELQGGMPRKDECQEWEKMAANRVPSIPGPGGLEPCRVVLHRGNAPLGQFSFRVS